MRSTQHLFGLLIAASLTACSTSAGVQRAPATWKDVVALPAPSPGQRIAYGPDAKQFGDLRLPKGRGPHPVAILVHGGCWRAEYTLDYFGPLSDQLARAGIATWNLEFRGIGDAGGGWPGTLEDVAKGATHLRALAATHPLDLGRVVLVGHSAGGHLATWLAAQHRSPPLQTQAAPLPVRGVVTLAGIVDLREYASGTGSCNKSVEPLLGGSAAQLPERYDAASPSALLPIGVPMRMLIGALDPIVAPQHNQAFAAQARVRGDDVDVLVIDGAGHFDLVLPTGPAAKRVQRAVKSLLRGRGRQ